MTDCNGCKYLRQERTRFGIRNWCEYARIVCELKHTKTFDELLPIPEWCLVRLGE